MNVYPKNSFDRFGDDLTELILQYLTFEDKVRLECVSKQWRRLVFNKQFVIEFLNISHKNKNSLNGLYRGIGRRKKLNKQSLESVLKKCPNIKNFNLQINVKSSVLSLIGRYCPNIKSLKYNKRVIGSDDNVLSFFRINGHKLEELYLYKNNNEFKNLLEFCANVRKAYISDLSVPLSQDKEFLPKLEHILSKIGNNQLKILSDKYSQTMKTLNIQLCYETEEELKTCIECIARFENLQSLTLHIKYNITSSKPTQPIDDCLSLIGQKCTKLLKLDLSISPWLPISDRTFKALSEFKTLKKMTLYLPHFETVNTSIECFKHCKQLKQLEISYIELREDFFANIASFVPKLQSLCIHTTKQFSDSFINSFHSMKDLQKVHLFVDNRKEQNGKIWYFGKSVSGVMLSPNGMNVKHITHNCALIAY